MDQTKEALIKVKLQQLAKNMQATIEEINEEGNDYTIGCWKDRVEKIIKLVDL